MITESNWDLWLLGFALAWAAVEFVGWLGRDGWVGDYPYDDEM